MRLFFGAASRNRLGILLQSLGMRAQLRLHRTLQELSTSVPGCKNLVEAWSSESICCWAGVAKLPHQLCYVLPTADFEQVEAEHSQTLTSTLLVAPPPSSLAAKEAGGMREMGHLNVQRASLVFITTNSKPKKQAQVMLSFLSV